MQRHHSRGPHLPLIGALLLTLAMPACLDGPFARVNPHDAGTALQLRIVGGSDTLRIAGEQVLFQLVTDPVTSGYTVSWSSSQTSRLLPLGLGRFQVISIPAVATTVEISAALGANVATRNIVLVPAP